MLPPILKQGHTHLSLGRDELLGEGGQELEGVIPDPVTYPVCPWGRQFSSVQSLSHVWLCDPMDCSTPGFPVLHYLPEFAQTSVHWVDDIINISFSVTPFSSPLQSSPASGSFPVIQLVASDGQSIWASASVSVLPINIHDWLPLGLTGLIS